MSSVKTFFALVFSLIIGYLSWLYLPGTGIEAIDANREVTSAVIGLLTMAFILKVMFPLLSRTKHRHHHHVLPELDVSEQKHVTPTEFKPLGLESKTWQKDNEIFCTACGATVAHKRHCPLCGAKLR